MKVLRTPAIPSTQSAGKVYNQNSRHLESGFLPGFCWLLDQSLLLHIALLPFNLFNMAFQVTSARSCPFPPQNLPTPSHLNQIGDGIHVCACVYKCVCPCEHVWRPKASVKCLPAPLSTLFFEMQSFTCEGSRVVWEDWPMTPGLLWLLPLHRDHRSTQLQLCTWLP